MWSLFVLVVGLFFVNPAANMAGAPSVRYYGWRPDLPDHRDVYISLAPSSVSPSMVDLRLKGLPPVYDQGALGSCTSFAIGAALQYDEMQQTGGPGTVPGFLFIYYNERVLEGTVSVDSGASLRDGIRAVAGKGYVNESMWPYDISRFDVEPPANVYAAAASHKAVEYARVPQTMAGLKEVLASGYPIVFGITVYESFESPDVARTGHVPMPSKKERVLGGHALLIVGFKDDTREFIVRNSWSASFGDAGYIYLPYAYVTSKNLAQDFWVVRRVSGAGWQSPATTPEPSFLEMIMGLRQSPALYI